MGATILLACFQAETPSALRQTGRQYVTHLLEYIWVGYERLSRSPEPPWYLRWLSRRSNLYNPRERQAVLELYWWLHIVMAREQGTLPAWEGIRIVRVRKVV